MEPDRGGNPVSSPAAAIAGRTAAQAFQLAVEYDPQPPFDSGSPAKASQAAKDYLAAR